MQIGLKIKKLRKENDITQEQLAEYLSISSRAVSQWECGKTMPDISQLPVLANIFNVTTDFLLGVSIDENSNIINSIIREAEKNTNIGHHEKATLILRDGFKKYPNSHKIMLNLAWSLWYERDLPNYNENYESITYEIIEFCEKILNESTDNEIRNSAIMLLCRSYPNVNQTDKAIELAAKMPDKYLTRESLLRGIYKGTQRFELLRDHLWSTITDLYHDMLFNCAPLDNGSRPYTTKELILIHQKYFDIMNILFEDGNFGFFRNQLSRAYCNAAAFCVSDNQIELALKYLSNAAKNSIICDTKYNADDVYTCTLFNGKKFGGVIYNSNANTCQVILDDIKGSDFDKLRDNSDFISIYNELKTYAGIRNY